jgi:hypothetical protein
MSRMATLRHVLRWFSFYACLALRSVQSDAQLCSHLGDVNAHVIGQSTISDNPWIRVDFGMSESFLDFCELIGDRPLTVLTFADTFLVGFFLFRPICAHRCSSASWSASKCWRYIRHSRVRHRSILCHCSSVLYRTRRVWAG